MGVADHFRDIPKGLWHSDRHHEGGVSAPTAVMRPVDEWLCRIPKVGRRIQPRTGVRTRKEKMIALLTTCRHQERSVDTDGDPPRIFRARTEAFKTYSPGRIHIMTSTDYDIMVHVESFNKYRVDTSSATSF